MARRRPARPGALTDLPPLKIVKKIILLQLAYYVCATVLILFTAMVAGTTFTPDLILSWRGLRGDTTVGWLFGFVWLLNSSIGVIFLLLLVSRSKLVPDFALTIHFIHLVVTTLYAHGLPSNWLWWGLQFASAALMIVLGMWACQLRELRPIVFGGHASNHPPAPGQGRAQAQAPAMADEEAGVGFPVGRGRGRDRDDHGAYEMVGMKKDTRPAG